MTPQDARPTLHVMTCGSVDDGKSTLIGRLLHDTGALAEDQIAALARDSRTTGHADGQIDYALVVDGLEAEREQGITIDVAYRHVATPRRRLVFADTPGHAQYTRNMVTAASTAQVAIVLVDVRKGLLEQTCRHARLASLLGVPAVILAVTKMDLVAGSQAAFEAVETAFRALVAPMAFRTVGAVPVSGLTGDNVVVAGTAAMPWFAGPPLLAQLEALEAEDEDPDAPFRMSVQGVQRGPDGFRGYTGQIASGRIGPGDTVTAEPSGLTATVRSIVDSKGEHACAQVGQSILLTLHEDIDLGRGDILATPDAPLSVADQIEATVIWMDTAPLLPGRLYDLMLGTRTVSAQITDIRHQVQIETGQALAARTLALNAIGVCHLSLGRKIAFLPYAQDRQLGGFILIDRQTQATVGAGLIHFALRRADTIHPQATRVTRTMRAALKHQRPVVVWFTGLSGSGKSTIANAVEARLAASGRHAMLIDGDNLRGGLSRDLGFTDADRVENIRRAAETARMMSDAGLIVLVALISPFAAERDLARRIMAEGEFVECFVDTDLSVAEARDPKGLYRKARSGDLRNFTGIDSPYEPPRSPDIHLRTSRLSVEQAADIVIGHIEAAISTPA